MKSLSDLQEQLEACTAFVKQLTGMLTGTTRGPYTKKANGAMKKANGAALRAQVHEAWQDHKQRRKPRGNGLEMVEADPTRLTIPEAAKLVKLSEAGLRYQIKMGKLRAVKEMRTTKKTGPGAFPHMTVVMDSADVQALAAERNGNESLPAAPTVKTTKASRPAKQPRLPDKERRQRTAALLAKLDREEPRNIDEGNRLSVLMQHGYVRAKGAGYIRTAKEFVV